MSQVKLKDLKSGMRVRVHATVPKGHPPRHKDGEIEAVLSSQFTYVPEGGLWPEYVHQKDFDQVEILQETDSE